MLFFKLCYITNLNRREIIFIYIKSTLSINFRKQSIEEGEIGWKICATAEDCFRIFFPHDNSLIKTIQFIHFKRLLAILLLQNYLLMMFSSLDWQKCQKSLAFAIQKQFSWIQNWKPFKNDILLLFFFSSEEHKIIRILSAFNIFLNPQYVDISTRRIFAYGQPE